MIMLSSGDGWKYHKIGSYMYYWVLTVSGKVVSQTSVQHVNRDEMPEPVMVERIKGFYKALEELLDDTNFANEEAGGMCMDNIEDADDAAHGDGSNTPSDDDYAYILAVDRTDRDDLDDDAYVRYIGAEVLMDVPGEGSIMATVKSCVRNDDGKVVGNPH